MAKKILIVEDHPLMQRMMEEFIVEASGLEVGGVAATGEQALEHLSVTEMDLVLVDMSLPSMSGAELIEEIQEKWPDLPCVVLSGHGEPSYVKRALTAGARGYILKGDPYELEGAIHEVLDGKIYLSKSLQGI